MIYKNPSIITFPNLKAAMPDLLDEWTGGRINEGSQSGNVYTLDPNTPAHETYNFVQSLNGKTDAIWFLGNFHSIVTIENPDSHGNTRVVALPMLTVPNLPPYYWTSADGYNDEILAGYQVYNGYADVSSLYTEGITVYSGKSPMDLYRDYLVKRHNYSVNGAPDCDYGIFINDHFGNYDGIRPGVDAQLAGYTDCLHEHLTTSAVPGVIDGTPDGIGNDHAMEQLGLHKSLLAIILAGGWGATPPYLFFFGNAQNWVDRGCKAVFLGVEGSYQQNFYQQDNMLRAAVCGQVTMGAFYIGFGMSPFGGLFTGDTLGRLDRLYAQRDYGAMQSTIGDVTVFMDTNRILQTRLDAANAQITLLNQQISSMKQANNGTPTPTPVPISAGSGLLANGSFLTTGAATGFRGIYALGGGWTGTALIEMPLSAANNGAAPNGGNTLEIQSTLFAEQVLSGLTAGQTYPMVGLIASRINYPAGILNVKIDGQVVGTATPKQVSAYGYDAFTINFAASLTSHTLRLESAGGIIHLASLKI
jgi:hypothetical protein